MLRRKTLSIVCFICLFLLQLSNCNINASTQDDSSQLIASTYLRYLNGDYYDCTVDTEGNVIIVGSTTSEYIITTPDAEMSTINGSRDIYLAKFNPSLTELLYATYWGGSSNEDPFCVKTDDQNNIYLCGWVTSQDFPLSEETINDTMYGDEGFLTKFDSQGQMVYSTLLGDTKFARSLTILPDYSVIVAGEADTGFEPTIDAYDYSFEGSTGESFLMRVSPDGSEALYKTFLGGSEADDIIFDIDSNGYEIAFTGYTRSQNNFPITGGAYAGGTSDIFIGKMDCADHSMDFLYYYGSSSGYDVAYCVAIDNSSNIYIGGYADGYDFPVTYNTAFDPTKNGKGVISKFDYQGELLYSSYFGNGEIFDIGYTNDEDIIITGRDSNLLYITPDAYQSSGYGFLSVISTTSKSLIYSSYFPEIVLAADFCDNKVVLTGGVDHLDFPIIHGCFDPSGIAGDSYLSVLEIPRNDQIDHELSVSISGSSFSSDTYQFTLEVFDLITNLSLSNTTVYACINDEYYYASSIDQRIFIIIIPFSEESIDISFTVISENHSSWSLTLSLEIGTHELIVISYETFFEVSYVTHYVTDYSTDTSNSTTTTSNDIASSTPQTSSGFTLLSFLLLTPLVAIKLRKKRD